MTSQEQWLLTDQLISNRIAHYYETCVLLIHSILKLCFFKIILNVHISLNSGTSIEVTFQWRYFQAL